MFQNCIINSLVENKQGTQKVSFVLVLNEITLKEIALER